MRNLKLKYCQQFSEAIVGQSKFLLLNCNSSNFDDPRYVVTDDKLFLMKPGSEDSPKVLAEVPGIVAAEYLALESEICLATAEGEVLLVNPETLQKTEGTFCDVGIECMSWSPDQEIVVFVTKQHNIVVMTCTYDPICEHPLDDESAAAEGEFVNVGWGKKETQFHGSEGKQAAKQKLNDEHKVNLNELAKDIFIDWRADGAYFVVSFVSQARGRTFKVFDREGKLQYAAEKQPNLGAAIAWRPSGTWIAVPQILPNKCCIALFEKNGLRHRELVLPFDLQKEPVESIKWSSDSEILCLKTPKNLYLYTIGNYHWYLKQKLEFSAQTQINHFQWDNRMGEEKTLHILLETGKYLVYKWHWAIDRYDRYGLVFVVDGKRLLITNFSQAVIPPPMFSQELQLENNAFVISVCFLIYSNSIHLYLYDSKHNIHHYKAILESPITFYLYCCYTPQDNIDDFIPLQYGNLQLASLGNPDFIGFDVADDIYLVAHSTIEKVTTLKFIVVNSGEHHYDLRHCLNITGTVYALKATCEKDSCHILLQSLDDYFLMWLEIDLRENIKVSRRLHAQLESPIEHLECYTEPSKDKTFSIALTSNQSLFINAQRFDQDVTSFCMAGNYLAYTKLSSLHFLRLNDMRLMNERRLEKGSKLVSTVPNLARTILQMPRGNLEAICPRVLSLELVGDLLQQKRYSLAFDMLRKHRINFNILCDHNMCGFVENLHRFIEDIVYIDWLNLFISNLQNEDFTKTMYASYYKENSQIYPKGFEIKTKVNFLCKALCRHLEEISEECYCTPIITAYVKMGELEKALGIVWKAKIHDPEEGDRALKHLLYLVDVNELYNIALGTYDFGLALFVAQKSQKDPKEYLAFLNELKSYDLDYRKFKIDEYLKRYKKAFSHIVKCGKEKFEEALTFIKKHEYYAQALKAYSHDHERYQEICLIFADFLRAQGKLENASILYERASNLQQALLSAKHALDWQRVLMLAQKLDPTSIKNVAMSLIAPLQEQGKYLEAYQLAKEFADNFSLALESLFMGKLFLTAIYEINMQQNCDLQQTLLLPNLLNYHKELCENLMNEEEQFLKHKQRLLEVRVLQTRKDEETALNGSDQPDIDECDLLSDTTSVRSSRYTASSRGTGKTFRSSKNRRKHERKLLSFKPGNPFEDIAYIDALYNQITRSYSQQQHIHDACKALILCNCDDLATGLQQQQKKLLNLMQDSLDEIWIPEMQSVSAAQQLMQGPNIDYTQLRNEQRYAMMDPQKRFKPPLTVIDWEHDILQV